MGLLERCSHHTQVIGDECQPESTSPDGERP
jgi:hypothetical protein